MIAFFAIPLVRKAILYGAIALAVLYGFKLWLNKHDAKVLQEGKEAIAEEQRIKAENTIKAEREALAIARKSALDAVVQLSASMDKLEGKFNDAIKQSKKTQSGNAPAVLSILDSDLNAAIRSELGRQRATNTR